MNETKNEIENWCFYCEDFITKRPWSHIYEKKHIENVREFFKLLEKNKRGEK